VNLFTDLSILLIGYLLGVLTNVLADYLAARRDYAIARSSPFVSESSRPVHPRFGPRHPETWALWPVHFWSGIIARLAQQPVFKPARTTRRIAVEIGLPLVFLLIAHQFPGARFLPFYWYYAIIFALVIVIDVEYRWILIEVIGAGVVGVLVEAILAPRFPFGDVLMGGLYGFLILFALYVFGIIFGQVLGGLRGQRIGRTVFGLGDVYMGLLSGCILGPQAIGVAMLFMMLSGGVAALILSVSRRLRRGRGRRMPRYAAIPYGPHIVIGTALLLYLPTFSLDALRQLIEALHR